MDNARPTPPPRDANPPAASLSLGAVHSHINHLQSTHASMPWNTADLGLRLCGDVVAASAAGGLVAPLIAAIDRSIIENAAGRRTISQSLASSLTELLTRPHAVLLGRPFGLVFLLYSATYLSANAIDTASSTLATSNTPTPSASAPDPRSPAATTAGTPKFLATSATNLSLCVYKDSRFARLFGAAAASSAGPLPRASLALFAARDALTVFASFNLPPLIAPVLPAGSWEAWVSRASAAQFLAPAAVQALSTPLHLLGLDLYNRPGPAVAGRERVRKIVADWGKSCAARVARIVPAFGVGGVVNAKVRRAWMERLPSARAVAQ